MTCLVDDTRTRKMLFISHSISRGSFSWQKVFLQIIQCRGVVCVLLNTKVLTTIGYLITLSVRDAYLVSLWSSVLQVVDPGSLWRDCYWRMYRSRWNLKPVTRHPWMGKTFAVPPVLIFGLWRSFLCLPKNYLYSIKKLKVI